MLKKIKQRCKEKISIFETVVDLVVNFYNFRGKSILTFPHPLRDVKSSAKRTNSRLSKWKHYALKRNRGDRYTILFYKVTTV